MKFDIDALLPLVTLATMLGCGLMAGTFFAFSTFIMKALAGIPQGEGIAAMQSINRTVINPWFLLVFMGTAAACILLAIVSVLRWEGPGAVYLLAGSALYFAGTFLVTMICNVPRNNALAKLGRADPRGATLWPAYLSSWTAWNHVRTIASLAAAALLTLALAGPAFAQAPAGLTMHRVQAGEADASGWMLAASTEGGFSVRLPLKFNDFTVLESDAKAPVLRIFGVGARSSEGIKFTATRMVYRKGAAAAREFFSRFEKGRDLGATPERVTPHRLGERRAVDLVLKRAAAVSYQRAVLLDADLLLLIVEAPHAHEATARQFSTAFFDSLVLER